MKQKLKFPAGFLWGVGSSAYQVEGNNLNNDWYKWETKNPKIERAGIACNQYETYSSDFKLAKRFLNNNIHRLSIEWSRIYPKKNVVDKKEIEHYRKVLKTLKNEGLLVMLTLHHYTNPTWFADLGSWEKKDNIKYFMNYVKTIAGELGDLVDYWMIFNEPNLYAFQSFLIGRRTPEKKNIITTIRVYLNLAAAHNLSYKLLHKHFRQAKVTTCFNFIAYKTEHSLFKPLSSLVSYLGNFSFIDLTRNCYDFIGVNYYNSYSFGKPKQKKILSDFGWPVYPKGIYEVSREVYSRYKIPIIITENGIADAKDIKRSKYITDHLIWVHRAIEEGVDIRGYFHWTLIDNYEWEFGRKMKFGLFEMDFKTLKRTPRKSAYLYAKICRENALSVI